MSKSTTVIKALEHYVYVLHQRSQKMTMLDNTTLKRFSRSELLQNTRIVNLICVF